MPIENIPEIYSQDKEFNTGLFVYDFKMTNNVVKSKVNLSMNMFSFCKWVRNRFIADDFNNSE
jgi:hypothetical protein